MKALTISSSTASKASPLQSGVWRRSQKGSTWIRFPASRVSEARSSLPLKSRMLTLATPVNSFSPGPCVIRIRVFWVPTNFLFSSNRNASGINSSGQSIMILILFRRVHYHLIILLDVIWSFLPITLKATSSPSLQSLLL